jgi:ABC-2 type transport system permease protein
MSMEAKTAPEICEARAVSAAQRFYWSLRREFWENRYIYVAPLAIAAAFLLALIAMPRHLPDMHALAELDPMKQMEELMRPYDIAAGFILAVSILVAAFYCVEALYGERRDRSILFWKSLPVSDATTVLTKAFIALIIVPLIGFAVTVATDFIVLLLSSAMLAGKGQSVAFLWGHLPFVRMLGLLLYHLLTAHVLWAAPLFGWILLVSAWAPRAPFVWAFLPPVAIVYLERITLSTRHFLDYLQYRFMGNGMEAISTPDTFPIGPGTHPTPLLFLSSAGLWAGLAITAVFLFAAARLRRSRGPA